MIHDEEKEIQDYCKMAFATNEGKAVLDWLIKTYYDRPKIFVKGDSDGTAHRLGQRDLVHRLKKFVEEKPNK